MTARWSHSRSRLMTAAWRRRNQDSRHRFRGDFGRTRAALTSGLLHWLPSRRSMIATAVGRVRLASRALASTTRRCTQRSRAPRFPSSSHRATARRAGAESRRNGSLDAWSKMSATAHRHAAENVNDARAIALRASGRLRGWSWRFTVDSFESGLGSRGGGAAARSSSTESVDMACLGLRKASRLRAGGSQLKLATCRPRRVRTCSRRGEVLASDSSEVDQRPGRGERGLAPAARVVRRRGPTEGRCGTCGTWANLLW